MTYLLISVLKKLPPTPYVKWIEYWLIFAQMVPFITSIQWLMENDEEDQIESRKEAKHEDLVLIRGKLVWVRKTCIISIVFNPAPRWNLRKLTQRRKLKSTICPQHFNSLVPMKDLF